MPLFKHTPLKLATDEIRLLSIDPGGDLGDIQCTLATYRLDSRPYYCALSYEWGDPDLAVDIKINGNVFQARHNLWLFLHRLKAARRSQGNVSGPTSKLWIDALCIDQKDVAERSAQVQLMGRIYREACGVIVWLGWSDGLDPDATSTLAKEIASDPIYGHESYVDLSVNGYPQIESNDDAIPQGIYAFMLELCRKTYWTRRWIIQEILMAKRVLLVYGQQELPWAAVCMTFERYQTYTKMLSDSKIPAYYGKNLSKFDTILESTAARIWRHQNMRKGSSSGTSLASLLHDYRSMQCESVYDRVYALKGLTENRLLDTDYSISPPQLYSRVLGTVIRQDRHAFRCWRDYAADCGLTVQPLSPTDATTQEHDNAVGASVCLKTATTDYVISTMECTLFFEVLEHMRDKYMELRNISSVIVASSLHKRLAGLLHFNWGEWDFPSTAVKSIYVEHGETVTMHDAILDWYEKNPKENARAPPIIFVSRNPYRSTTQLSVSWSNIKLGDFLCHVFGNCYLILRRDGEAFELVGPAWMVLEAEQQASVIVRDEVGLLLRDMFKNFLCTEHFPMDFEDRFWHDVQLHGFMAQFDVMDLIRLLQINEEVMEAAGLEWYQSGRIIV
jgi:hypothetical protein